MNSSRPVLAMSFYDSKETKNCNPYENMKINA